MDTRKAFAPGTPGFQRREEELARMLGIINQPEGFTLSDLGLESVFALSKPQSPQAPQELDDSAHHGRSAGGGRRIIRDSRGL